MTLADWGWDDRWAEQAVQLDIDSSMVCRIVGQDRASWSLRTREGAVEARITTASFRDATPVVGDWVLAEAGPTQTDHWSILRVLPRRSSISRGRAGTGKSEQVLAANIDKVWVVHGMDVEFNPRRLERYLAVVWESGASPEIILTKADLTDDLETWVSEVEAVSIGVPVRSASAMDAASVLSLRDTLDPGTTVTLLGPSGVGKSTLVNLLSEEDVAPTGDVRTGDRKGRHTTTRRELYRIPGGALLLDTPGMRELRVWVLDEGLDHTFPEIEELARNCRFRDCRHEGEPGCAVIEAFEAGELAADRLDSYRKLRAEAAYEERKADPRARAAAVSEWKTAMKTMKYHQKRKGQG